MKPFACKTIVALLLAVFPTVGRSQCDKDNRRVVLETTMGTISLKLYDDTPLHRDNFIKNVSEGYYDGILFHRVIEGFMIQAGASARRHALPTDTLGGSEEPYTIPAEIRYPQHCHKRGVLAAAREPDDVNPEKASSAYQFYIVYGKRMSEEDLDKTLSKVSAKNGTVFTDEVRNTYLKKGGTPHLDNHYTVFGEVTEGMDVVKAIQWVETDGNDRPLEDVRIVKAYVDNGTPATNNQ